MISWQERIALLGNQAGLSEIQKRKTWEEDGVDLPIEMLESKLSESGSGNSDYQAEIDGPDLSDGPESSLVLSPINKSNDAETASKSPKIPPKTELPKLGRGRGVKGKSVDGAGPGSKAQSGFGSRPASKAQSGFGGSSSKKGQLRTRGSSIAEGTEAPPKRVVTGAAAAAVRMTKSEVSR